MQIKKRGQLGVADERVVSALLACVTNPAEDKDVWKGLRFTSFFPDLSLRALGDVAGDLVLPIFPQPG